MANSDFLTSTSTTTTMLEDTFGAKLVEDCITRQIGAKNGMFHLFMCLSVRMLPISPSRQNKICIGRPRPKSPKAICPLIGLN